MYFTGKITTIFFFSFGLLVQITLCFRIQCYLLSITSYFATQLKLFVLFTAHPFLIVNFFFLLSFSSIFSLFGFRLQIWFIVNLCLNLSTFCHLLYYNFSSSCHIIFIFLPSPTPNLPPPISLSHFAWAEANLWSTTLSTPIWILDCDFLYFMYFSYFDSCI